MLNGSSTSWATNIAGMWGKSITDLVCVDGEPPTGLPLPYAEVRRHSKDLRSKRFKDPGTYDVICGQQGLPLFVQNICTLFPLLGDSGELILVLPLRAITKKTEFWRALPPRMIGLSPDTRSNAIFVWRKGDMHGRTATAWFPNQESMK